MVYEMFTDFLFILFHVNTINNLPTVFVINWLYLVEIAIGFKTIAS